MAKSINQLADWAVGSLAMEPEAWSFDVFRAKHTSGVTVWIANGSYGLDIRDEGIEIGGVTPFSILFGWATWRGRVYRAARNAAIRKLIANAGAA